jgi:hypothetical protein
MSVTNLAARYRRSTSRLPRHFKAYSPIIGPIIAKPGYQPLDKRPERPTESGQTEFELPASLSPPRLL